MSPATERFRTFTGWPVAFMRASAYRLTKAVQPEQTIGLFIAIESPTATRDQGVGVGTDVSVADVKAVAQPLSKAIMKKNARNIDPIDFFITSYPYDFIEQDA